MSECNLSITILFLIIIILKYKHDSENSVNNLLVLIKCKTTR